MQHSNLNLARKWRPKNFDQIIGQKIQVRMLKNGLFLDKLFPVYLFAGQRGCGKTTTARVFGAALNCKNLELFKKDPKQHPIPCLTCESCTSMAKSNHPDFIEIDAASHTGVENVRQILENCSYMPTFGNKKIYLIDEAHMLSKAAFNAFLKILEEPPKSTLFILATTEINKFPQTVISRCFQVIFKPVDDHDLKSHIQNICTQEKIHIEDNAIDILIQETEGSVRDAINLLERVRFSQKKITQTSLLKVLGKVSEIELFNLIDTTINKNTQQLLCTLNSQTFENTDPQSLWGMIIAIYRAMLWIKFNVKKLPSYINDTKKLQELANKCSINRLNAIFQLFWDQEELFLKTPHKKIFLEMVLLQICQQVNIADLQEIVQFATQTPTSNNVLSAHNNTQPTIINKNFNWQNFITDIQALQDPMLTSILQQSTFIGKKQDEKLLTIILKSNNAFIKDKIEDSKNIWLPVLQKHFAEYQGFEYQQEEKMLDKKNVSQKSKLPQQHFHSFPSKKGFLQAKTQKTSSIAIPIDISDKEKWPKANLLTEYFTGKIKKVTVFK
jgi:DNA polymerase-3 subunit gamma/tau